MSILSLLRRCLGLWKTRNTPPIGRIPKIGAVLTRERIKFELPAPIDKEQWEWLTDHGWRAQRRPFDRRRYFRLSRRYAIQLLDENQRELVEAKILVSGSAQTNPTTAPVVERLHSTQKRYG